MSTVTTQSKEK